MAGGIGSRFWPISRTDKPKQFLDFTDSGISFLRKTYDRFARFIPKDNIIVVSLTRYKDLVKEHLPEVAEDNIILEPYNRNTAPCVALAAYTLLKRDPEAVMVATPADHIILNNDIFQETILNAFAYASQSDALITLGIVPTRPDSNFGYIQGVYGQTVKDGRPIKVKTFTEKPDAALAEVFVKSGEFYWNSGIFIWKARTIREELEKYMPEVKRLFDGWETALGTPAAQEFIDKAYASINKISIDYAVMEKTDKAWLYPSNFRWFDIGSWESLYNYKTTVNGGDNVMMTGPSLCRNNHNSLVFTSDKKKLVVVQGLEDYVVVDTDDVLMICPRDERISKEIIANISLPDYEEFK
mgnify:CR=1 FL=1